MTATEDVVQHRDDDHAAVHDHAPVHRLLVDGRRQGEEGEDEDGQQERQGADVDGHAKPAQGPAMGRQGVAPQTLQ